MKLLTCSVLFLLPIAAAACGGDAGDDAGSTASQGSASASTDTAADVWLASVPADAQDVAEARADATEGRTMTVRGVIGGSKKPFVDGLAAFQLIDPALEPCAVGEGCPTPWDYCCVDPRTIAANSITVEVRDGDAVRAGGLRGSNGLDHLAEVVVQGVAERDERGNVTIVASGVIATD